MCVHIWLPGFLMITESINLPVGLGDRDAGSFLMLNLSEQNTKNKNITKMFICVNIFTISYMPKRMKCLSLQKSCYHYHEENK